MVGAPLRGTAKTGRKIQKNLQSKISTKKRWLGFCFFGQIDLSLLKISHMDNKQKLETIIKREEISARQYSDKISEWSQAFLNCLKSANLDTIQVDGDAVWLYIGDINAEFCRLKRRPTNQTKIYNFIDFHISC